MSIPDLKKIINEVENPKYEGAKATFGQKPSEKEVKQRNLLLATFEKFWGVLAVIVVGLILVANWQNLKNFLDFLTKPKEVVTIEEPTKVVTEIITADFEGKAFQIEEDLKWLRRDFFQNLRYYQAGELTKGEYQGAKRYLASGQLNGSQETWTFEFLKLTDGRVLMNGGKPNSQLWLKNLLSFYLGQLVDQDLVTLIDEIPSDFPQVLRLNTTASLYRQDFLTDSGPYQGLNGEGKLELALNPQFYKKLTPLEARKYKDLNFYSKVYDSRELFWQIAPNLNSDDEKIVDTYLEGGSKVIITDKTGLAMVYELVFTDKLEAYQQFTLASELINLEIYQQSLQKYTATTEFKEYRQKVINLQAAQLPQPMPEMPQLRADKPGFWYRNQDFEFKDKKSLFASFVPAYVPTCTKLIDAKVIQNITIDDLEPVGKIFIPQAEIYRLKDEQHPLNKLAYNLKFADSNLSDEELIQNNFELILAMKNYSRNELSQIRQGTKNPTLPSYEEYVVAMPLLFVVDPWGRILSIWENEIQFLQECDII